MLKKKILASLLCLTVVASFSSCGDKPAKPTSKTDDSAASTTTSAAETTTAKASKYTLGEEILNYTEPEEGEEIVVMTIKDYGEVKFKLFPELLPKAVENFVTHAKDGYYNGLTFHRVIADFMIQGGDPLGTGTGGESIWGGKFDGGVAQGLHHFAGALCYANSGSTSTDGSQFYIVTGEKATAEYLAQIKSYYGKEYCDAVAKKYAEEGGSPHLDGDYTVFGQVIEGLDIVKKIDDVETVSAQNTQPLEKVVIEKMEVVKYSK